LIMFVLEAAVSGILFAVSALLLGALMTAGFVLPRGEPAKICRQLSLFSLALLLAFLLVACIWLVVQGAKLQSGQMPSLDTLNRYLLRTQSGRIWLGREVYGVLLMLGGVLLLRNAKAVKAARILFAFALPLVVCRSLVSHASAVKENAATAIAVDAVHLVATALWAGGLPVLFWALFQGLRRLQLSLFWAAEAVARFSSIALGSVVTLLATGLYQSWTNVQTLHALGETPYGRVLILKLSVFCAMVGLGAINFLSTRPRLLKAAQAKGGEPLLARRALNRIGAEGFLGLLILCVTGFLTVLPPAIHSLHAQHQTASAAGRLQQGNKLAPAEGARVTILTPRPEQVFHGDQIPLQFTLARGKRGHHVHAYVDGQLMGMFESAKGTLTGIPPGRHTLELRVVAEDHQTELDASAQTDFVVK
jgi:putative copper export protein